MTNQWPDFKQLPKAKSVRRVLLEEGNGISERTNDEVHFVVESEPQEGRGFIHRCFLHVPKIGYRYPLLRVVQDNFDYPVTVVADNWPQGQPADDEPHLRRMLGLVFGSEAVVKLVPQLLELVS